MPGSQGSGPTVRPGGGLGGVESPGEHGCRVAGVVEAAVGDGLVEEVDGVVAVGCPQQEGAA